MALVPSGAIAIKDNTLQGGTTSIALEVDGNTTGDKNLATLGGTAGLSGGGTSMTEFYGYTTYGRLYGENLGGGSRYIKRVTNTTTYLMSGAVTLHFTANQNENIRIDDDASGTPVPSGDEADVTIYRRTKLTSDTWIYVTDWVTYQSETYFSDFSTYDYKWTINDII